MSAPVNHASSPPRKRSLFRFSLRTFLIATMLLGVVLGWFVKVQTRVLRQRRVVKQIQSVRAGVGYDYQVAGGWDDEKWQPPGPKVLRMLLGDDAFAEVHTVYLVGTKHQYESTPDDLASLAAFPRLQVLRVGGEQFGDESLPDIVRHKELCGLGLVETKVTARGLRELRALARLSMLELCGAGIDDDALHEVSLLQHLERLQLHGTSIGSDGWRNLANLRELKQLDIAFADAIGDAELAHLSGLTKLESLRLYRGGFSGEGLRQIAGLTQLRSLDLNGTPLGDEALETIRQMPRLERLWLKDAGITDAGLATLQTLRELRSLWVGPQVTKEAAERLQQELPQCTIRNWDQAGFEGFTLEPKH
jgi:hypothetical protein